MNSILLPSLLYASFAASNNRFRHKIVRCMNSIQLNIRCKTLLHNYCRRSYNPHTVSSHHNYRLYILLCTRCISLRAFLRDILHTSFHSPPRTGRYSRSHTLLCLFLCTKVPDFPPPHSTMQSVLSPSREYFLALIELPSSQWYRQNWSFRSSLFRETRMIVWRRLSLPFLCCYSFFWSTWSDE